MAKLLLYPCSLAILPLEIIQCIADNSGQPALLKLYLLNKVVHRSVEPILYRHILVKGDPKAALRFAASLDTSESTLSRNIQRTLDITFDVHQEHQVLTVKDRPHILAVYQLLAKHAHRMSSLERISWPYSIALGVGERGMEEVADMWRAVCSLKSLQRIDFGAASDYKYRLWCGFLPQFEPLQHFAEEKKLVEIRRKRTRSAWLDDSVIVGTREQRAGEEAASIVHVRTISS